MTDIKAEINLIKMANDVACIKQALLGNGQPGLCKRVANLENSEKKVNFVVGMCTGVGAVGGYFINNLIVFLKGG